MVVGRAYCALCHTMCRIAVVEKPALMLLVVFKLGCVVALVQVFKNGREYLGHFVGHIDTLSTGVGFEELLAYLLGEDR